MAQPCHLVATMRWWQLDNLSEVDVFIGWLRFLPDDSCRWHERKGERNKEGERKKEGERFFAPTGNPVCG
jgi:hypothetical protein